MGMPNPKDLRIGTRLSVGFLISALITIFVGVVAIYTLSRVNNTANDVINVDVGALAHADHLSLDVAKARRYEKEFFLFAETGDVPKREDYRGKLEERWTHLPAEAEEARQSLQACIPCHRAGEVPTAAAGIEDRADQLVQLVALSKQKLDVVVNLMVAGKSYEEVQPQYQAYRDSVHLLEDATRALAQDAEHMMEQRRIGMGQTQSNTRWTVIGSLMGAVLFGLLVSVRLTRSVTRPVRRLTAITGEIAAGDLSRRAEVTSKDEIGELATSFNKMTESLQRSRDQIQQKNGELREAQEQLVRSERLAAIGQLAGGVGHELRNPLGAIRNAVYYLKGKVAGSELASKEPRVPRFLEIIDQEVEASNKIISDLLSFSRVGRPAVSPTGLGVLMDDALGRAHLPENISVVKEVPPDLPQVWVDSDQIRQVLLNLLSNAQDAMPGGGEVRIRARREGEAVHIEVSDTGAGMPEEVRARVFDPLFTTKAKGIGLGLAVCQSIINRHQGTISVESEEGQGTTFTLTLPIGGQ